MSKKLPIILIGPYPPNIGGVSTHIVRLVPLLTAKGHGVSVLSVNKTATNTNDIKYIPPVLLPFILLFKPKSVLHFHVDSLSHLVVALFLKIRHPTYLTIHNNRYPTTMKDRSVRNRIKWLCLSSFKKIICVNSVTQQFLQNRLNNLHNAVIPAFLPPPEIDDTSIESVKKWGAQFRHVLSGYAYRLSFYQDQDLYGIDMMVNLMKELKQRKFRVGLVLLINLEDNPYLDKIRQDIEEFNLIDSVLLLDIKSGYDAVALWKYSDIYLRPTNTDGNSISIQEALSVGTSVVTSDCVERPKACLLFKDRDLEDFTEKVRSLILNPVKPSAQTNSEELLIEIY